MKLRSLIFWTHLVIGVTAGLVILSMAVTGTILAFEPQILEFAERRVLYVTPPGPDAQKLSLDVIAAKAKASQPEGKVTAVLVKPDPKSSVAVSLGREHTLYVNPYTGEVLGEGSKLHDVLHNVEEWHRWMGSRKIGKPITNAACLIFLALVISGFYLWWPKTWNLSTLKAVTTFNPRVQGKARDWNWHNVIGFWCAPILLVTTITGLIMAYSWASNALYYMTGNQPPPLVKAEVLPAAKSESEREVPPASLDVIFSAAQQHVPVWLAMNIRLPAGSDKPVTVLIQEPTPKTLKPRSQLILDPWTAEVIKWDSFAGQNLGRKLRIWTKPVHTGQAAGIFGQTVMFLGALGAIFLVWTGFSMAWYRFFSRKKI